MKERLKKYDNEIYTIPYWKGNSVYHESLTFINYANSKPKASLLFKPSEIISLRSSSLEIEYIEGKDFIVENNWIIVIEGSRIPVIVESDLYTEEASFPSKSCDKNYAYFSNGSLLEKQISVTYKHSDKWDGYIPQYCGEMLPKTVSKLKNREPLKIAFIGDSITALGDISGSQNCKPFMPRYSEMVTERMRTLSGSNIEYINLAIGGTSSNKYLEDEDMKNQVHAFKPDLVFIAYGMNDGGWLNSEKFTANISAIINDIKSKLPEAEFILISTVVPNKDACWANRSPVYIFQDDYEKAMEKLEQKGICVARINTIYNYLERKKGFWSMTATGLNHPNDFTVRMYTHTILQMIFEEI